MPRLQNKICIIKPCYDPVIGLFFQFLYWMLHVLDCHMYVLQCIEPMLVHVVKCILYSVADTGDSFRQLVTLCDGQQVYYNAHVG